ncbi:MAG: hypothetical protein LBM74_02640 [Oscillospiraceae bacterium]|jgi:hypothetical protein|nr:hypothetical protein [Oscillospiraceae bacterium]
MKSDLLETAYLYHYYDAATGPFLNLSDLSPSEADAVQADIVRSGKGFAAQRNERYLARRRELEQVVRDLFIGKGGQPIRTAPHYMVIGECPWLKTWYTDSRSVKIHVSEFDMRTVSFTYGDTFPTFSDKVTDDAEYRRRVYTYEEVLRLIDKYGLPQHQWNAPIFAQPAYVEAHVWSDDVPKKYRKMWA